jgi:hypothetical protein
MKSVSNELVKTGAATMERFIRNADRPICATCKFSNIGTSKKQLYCGKFGERNIITGDIKFEPASVCRIETNMCGISGIYYVPK